MPRSTRTVPRRRRGLSDAVAPPPISSSPTPRGSAFAAVRRVIALVPRGKVITYGQAARVAGLGRAARVTVRALQHANGLPWHRVVAAGGRIALPGVAGEEQRLRLRLEGVTFRAGRVDMALHEWTPRRRQARR
jgi:methylated-DNA-protein-cysteine methyltransferase related protein